MASMESLDALLQEELRDIYDAEKQLTKAIPKMARKAASEELKDAFEEHLRQTEQHVERLEQAFEQLEIPARGKKCVGMQNLIREGEEMIAEAEDDATRDAVMIAAAQKIEHYEIASYGTTRTWAQRLGKTEVASLLDETLGEEKETDQRLTEIAENWVNAEAQHGAESRASAQTRGRGQRGSARAARTAASSRTMRQAAADRSGRKPSSRSRSR